MASTKYQVFKVDAEGGETLVVTKSKRATAVDAARDIRNSENTAVRVATEAGHEVFSQAARKSIRMSPKYTRVVELPEDIASLVPEGARVAYVRPRRKLALLDLAEVEGDDSEERYALMITAGAEAGELLDERFATTRDAGQRLKLGIEVTPVPEPEPEPEPANA